VHGAKLERVIVEISPSPELAGVARFAEDHGARVERRPRGDLDRAAQGIRHQGAIAYAPELRLWTLDELPLGPDALVVALDELQDPQNFGAILRSATAMGATAVVWPEHRSAPLSPATFRASAGAVEHTRLCRVSALPSALESLRARGLAVVGLDANGPARLDLVDVRGPTVIVVGAEGKGLRKTVKSACDTLAHLPMAGTVASLNASVAVAIAMYETKRQRLGG
jgi:23S rRNA (guanosine2251-2'-O)-methyltransferase